MMTNETNIALPPLFFKEFLGEQVPALGFGTYELKEQTCRKAVAAALSMGYRHVDTARAYENEEMVGYGIQDSGVDRDDFFLTSKVWMEDVEPAKLKQEVEQSLKELQTDYLDLALIHWPNPNVPLEQSLSAMQELIEQGKLRHAGVSNFPPSLFKEAIEHIGIFCNQVEYHPLLSQDKLLQIARDNDVMLTAYSPLAQGEAIGHPVLDTIGEKHGKDASQIALRWLIEQDQVAAIPRSSTVEHIEENFRVFDFELDEEDRQSISSMPKDQRQINPSFAPDWEA